MRFKPTISGLNKWKEQCSDWNKIVLVKLGFIKKDFKVRMKNGLILNLIYDGRHDSTTMLKDLYVNNSYSFQKKDIKDCKIIVDIGANQGFVSTLLALKTKGSMIYSYEPMKRNYDSLVKNIKLNNYEDRIIPFNLAISKTKGKRKLFIDKFGNAAHSLLSSRVNNKNFVNVDSITLKDIFVNNDLTHIDLLKMDCEGAEFEIFWNSDDEDILKIKNIFIEIHNTKKNSVNELEDFLILKGFKISSKNNEVHAVNTNFRGGKK